MHTTVTFRELATLLAEYLPTGHVIELQTQLDSMNDFDFITFLDQIEDRLEIVIPCETRGQLETLECLIEALKSLGVSVTNVPLAA